MKREDATDQTRRKKKKNPPGSLKDERKTKKKKRLLSRQRHYYTSTCRPRRLAPRPPRGSSTPRAAPASAAPTLSFFRRRPPLFFFASSRSPRRRRPTTPPTRPPSERPPRRAPPRSRARRRGATRRGRRRRRRRRTRGRRGVRRRRARRTRIVFRGAGRPNARPNVFEGPSGRFGSRPRPTRRRGRSCSRGSRGRAPGRPRRAPRPGRGVSARATRGRRRRRSGRRGRRARTPASSKPSKSSARPSKPSGGFGRGVEGVGGVVSVFSFFGDAFASARYAAATPRPPPLLARGGPPHPAPRHRAPAAGLHAHPVRRHVGFSKLRVEASGRMPRRFCVRLISGGLFFVSSSRFRRLRRSVASHPRPLVRELPALALAEAVALARVPELELLLVRPDVLDHEPPRAGEVHRDVRLGARPRDERSHAAEAERGGIVGGGGGIIVRVCVFVGRMREIVVVAPRRRRRRRRRTPRGGGAVRGVRVGVRVARRALGGVVVHRCVSAARPVEASGRSFDPRRRGRRARDDGGVLHGEPRARVEHRREVVALLVRGPLLVPLEPRHPEHLCHREWCVEELLGGGGDERRCVVANEGA